MVNSNLLRGKIMSMGYTQDSIAQKMKISANTLSAKINGKSEFDLGQVEMLCDMLHIDSADEIKDIFLSRASRNRDT